MKFTQILEAISMDCTLYGCDNKDGSQTWTISARGGHNVGNRTGYPSKKEAIAAFKKDLEPKGYTLRIPKDKPGVNND